MTKLTSIVGSALPRAQRILAGIGRTGEPGRASFTPRTVWAVGVPVAIQSAFRTGMPDFAFRFVPADEPLAGRRARIVASERPCIALWNDSAPPDLAAFLRETKVATARLSPVPLMAQQIPNSWALSPYGIGFEMSDGSRPGAPAVPRRVARQALDLYLTRNCSEANFGRQGLQDYRPARPAVLIVADPPNHIAPRQPDRFAAYRTMLAETRARHAGREVIFVTNGDHELPPEVVEDIRRHADTVLLAPYDATMLADGAPVVAHRSWAAFDALARGLPATVYGASPLAGLSPGASALVDLFAARYMQRTCFLDPATGQTIDLPTALDLIASRREQMPGPHIAVSPAAGMTLPDRDDAAGVPASDVPFNRDRILPPRRDAVDPATVTGSLRLPDWVIAQDLLPPAGEASTICLRSDIAAAPRELRALARDWHVVEIDSDPTRPPSAMRVADLARRQPELFGRLVRQRVARAGRASQAVLTDLASPASRAFARACERKGLLRIYVPPAPFGAAEGWGEPPPLGAAAMLFDVALAWDESHRTALREAGYPADRILPVILVPSAAPMPPAAPIAARAPLILVDLALPWPQGEAADSLDAVAGMLAGLATAFDYRIRFHLSREAAESLSDHGIDTILQSDLADIEVEETEETSLADELHTATLLLADRPQLLRRARLAGVGAMPIDPAAGGLTDRMRRAVAGWIDAPPAPAATQPIAEAPPAATVLGKILSGKTKLSLLGPPKAIALRGSLPINLVTSPISADVLEQAERYELAMLGARHWIRATPTTPLADLAEVDLFLQWGVRPHPPATMLNGYRRRLDRDLLILEDGFIRSIAIGLVGSPTLSLVLDDMTAFYDATRPSRLETILNSTFEPSHAELARARAVMRLITSQKISKYNFAPYLNVEIGRPGRRKILVVDQREGDQSIEAGLASAEAFQRMARAAMAMTPEYDVIVKTHPDANIAGRASAIGGAMLARMQQNPAVTIVTQDMNPFSLIDIVDKVYVVTSGMGMEALLAEKDVACFGVPFYAGWGLTDDRMTVPRRVRKRSVAEIFHVFYIMLSRYFDPEAQRVCEIEDLIRHIAAVRPWQMPASGAPRIVLPDAGMEVASHRRPKRIPGLPEGGTLWLLGIERADCAAFQKLYQGWDVRLAGDGATVDKAGGAIRRSYNPVIVARDPDMDGLGAFCRRWSIPLFAPGNMPVDLPPELARYRAPFRA